MATSTLTDFYATEPNNLCPACIIEWDEWLKGVSNPSEHRRIEKALRNSQSHDFRSAYLELFFHQYFAAQGAVIEWHPKLPDTSHRPEFLVHLNGDQFLFEARISDIKAIFREQQDFCRLLKPLIEELVKPLLQVQVFVLFNTGQNAPPLHAFPSLKAKLVDFVEMGIAKFVNGFLAKKHLRHSIRWRGTEYTFTYVLSRLEGKNLPSQVVYGFGGTSGLAEKLYEKIEVKARRYGVPDKPFVIGIWFYGIYTKHF